MNTESIVMLPHELCSFPLFLVNSSLECIKNDLPKFRLHFDDNTRAWWEKFLRNNGRTTKANPKWILPDLTQQREAPRPLKVSKSPDELFKLIEKEERDVEVIVFSFLLLEFRQGSPESRLDYRVRSQFCSVDEHAELPEQWLEIESTEFTEMFQNSIQVFVSLLKYSYKY